MKLLVDEDSQARRLLDAQAQNQGRALLTHNVADFLALAQQAGADAGVLAIFRDGNPRNTMSHEQIVRAIGALQATGLPVQGQFHILNHWR